MNSDKLSIDLNILKRMHGTLSIEIAYLQKIIVQLRESVDELDTSWEQEFMTNFNAEFVSAYNHLNILIESMKVLERCMSYALNTYIGCEYAAMNSIKAIDSLIAKGC